MKTISNMLHFSMNIVLTGFVLLAIGICFLMVTDTDTATNTNKMLKMDYSTESINYPRTENIKGNPEKWIIISVSEDYSTAKVIKEDGYVYYMTIFQATDDTIDIEVNGDIHTFNYSK